MVQNQGFLECLVLALFPGYLGLLGYPVCLELARCLEFLGCLV